MSFLGSHVEELVLLNYSVPYEDVLLGYIGKACPNLRVLKLEVSVLMGQFKTFEYNLQCLLESCRRIESLCVKVRGVKVNEDGFMLPGIYNLRPTSIKALKLEPAAASDTLVFFTSVYASVAPMPVRETLTHVSLVLDNITNAIIPSILKSLSLLTELDLKDRPTSKSSDDLSDIGFQSIIGCKHLISLSLRRSRKNHRIYFNLVTDVGMFLLAEGCKQLEYVQLDGFNKVTDAGYARVLNACLILKKLEIRHGVYLEDLAFQDLSKVCRSSLLEVKLVSCFIASEAVRELETCSASMKVLNLCGCERLSDSALSNISRLASLTYLNMEGTDVTDVGMAFLGKGKAPISYLSLRHCGKVTDKGISLLVGSEGKMFKTLSSLDLGYMGGVRRGESKLLLKLDMYECSALSIGLFKLLKKPFFCGLQRIGIGHTHVQSVQHDQLAQILKGRRVLTICKHGCKMGCRSKWHERQRVL
ncbi:F-box domain, cyclin-like protein [Tanacetum coccineum]